MSKVRSYEINGKSINLVHFTKAEADVVFDVIKEHMNTPEIGESSGVSLGRVVDGTTVTISVVKYDATTKAAKVIDNITTTKLKSNNEMRKLMAKYNLLD